MPSIIITGMPGSGKTHLSMKLASELMDRNISTLILHTDIMKIAMRQFYGDDMRHAAYRGNIQHKSELMLDIITRQAFKADHDGYTLIIEGTLAAGLDLPDSLYVVLDISEEERIRRIKQKHKTARDDLLVDNLDEYRVFLESHENPKAFHLRADQSIDELIKIIISNIKPTSQSSNLS